VAPEQKSSRQAGPRQSELKIWQPNDYETFVLLIDMQIARYQQSTGGQKTHMTPQTHKPAPTLQT
jgi:hypothetical protein